MTDKKSSFTEEKFRIDKWLFAARFYKTRALAAEAIERGQVQINGSRIKPSRTLNIGDMLDIRIGSFRHVIAVLALSKQRRPASEARMLYEETEESRLAREAMVEKLKAQPVSPRFAAKGRPTKRDRRQLERFMSGR